MGVSRFATLEIRETSKMSFHFPNHEKLLGIWEKTSKSWENDKVIDNKGFRQFGLCVFCHVSKLCPWTTGCGENISHRFLELSKGNKRENSGNFIFKTCWELYLHTGYLCAHSSLCEHTLWFLRDPGISCMLVVVCSFGFLAYYVICDLVTFAPSKESFSIIIM